MIEDILKLTQQEANARRKKIGASNFSAAFRETEVNYRIAPTMFSAPQTLSLKRILYSSPFVGYLSKLCASIIRLPVRFKQIYQQLGLLQEAQQHLQFQLTQQAEVNTDWPKVRSELGKLAQEMSVLSTLNHNVTVQNEGFRSQIQEKLTRILEIIPSLEAKLQCLSSPIPSMSSQIPTANTSLDPAFYAAFERRFRSPSVELHQHFQAYRPFLANITRSTAPLLAVDLGCGRGEWLKVLQAEGFRVTGVDINLITNETAKDSTMSIIDADALSFLRSQANGLLDLISSFHLIEHLEPGYLVQTLFEAFRCLKPGGILLLETPNPENLVVGACNFYTDPTHERPIPPAALAFMIDYCGFNKLDCLRFQSPLPTYLGADDFLQKIAPYFTAGQDYAIIAQKPF